jgi:hypothetical protein
MAIKKNSIVKSSKNIKARENSQPKDQELARQKKEKKLARKLNKIKSGIESGEIKTFDDIFIIINLTPFGQMLGHKFYRFNEMVADPGLFSYNDTVVFSNLIQAEFKCVNDFLTNLVKDPNRKTEERYKPLYFNK